MNQPTTKQQPANASPEVFARNLKHLMIKEDLSNKELAMKLRISHQRVNNWMDGTCFPSAQMMVILCNLFSFFNIYKLITQPINEEDCKLYITE